MNPLRWTIGQVLGGLLTVGGVSIASLVLTTSYLWVLPDEPVQSQVEDIEPEPPEPTIAVSTPRILKFTLTLTSPEDLKISQDDQIEAGQTIADRRREREKLTNQLELLNLSLQRIKSRVVQAPPKPLPVPSVLPLPEVSYRQEEAEIVRVKRLIELQQQKINLLQTLGAAPPETQQHENLMMERLIQELAAAEATLKAAQESRKYEEYQHSLTVARRQEEANQQALFYANQQQEYEAQVRDREFQIAGIQEKIANVQQRLEDLAIVTAPYPGTVRRIKWLGQTNNSLEVEVTLAVDL
ncbi:MAG: hypothetical protein ACO3NK_02100 [Prochlorotrichaceae cyanobacterium]